jgi:hypothetical protein
VKMAQLEEVVAVYCRPVPSILEPLRVGLTPSLQRGGGAVEVVDKSNTRQELKTRQTRCTSRVG